MGNVHFVWGLAGGEEVDVVIVNRAKDIVLALRRIERRPSAL